MTLPPDTNPTPLPGQDFAHLGLTLLRRLGVNGMEPARESSLLALLLPDVGRGSYPTALLRGLTLPDGRVPPSTEADEARWLADHLHLEGLARLDGPLGALWQNACQFAEVDADRARVDPDALLVSLPSLARDEDYIDFAEDLAAALTIRAT
ncbi:hypothetical protein [Paraconexibacter algicola]|uniref:Uncharacterized protein n=1 Tax=Paraconexibacter algicola TaxID=2133960 RepID=A0A2T4UCY6_9ACTN|nr:hypothetical protein [Paraconexibacter algicola]PTL55369.1 hypothetical protein C7Y72_17045 [Paraconexibacter algicola]